MSRGREEGGGGREGTYVRDKHLAPSHDKMRRVRPSALHVPHDLPAPVLIELDREHAPVGLLEPREDERGRVRVRGEPRGVVPDEQGGRGCEGGRGERGVEGERREGGGVGPDEDRVWHAGRLSSWV